MDTRDIERFIDGDIICRASFQGVFSRDTLPPNPRLLICNTDPSYKPGQHWIAIYVDDCGRGEYFDSFGMAPDCDFKQYMDEHCRSWMYNKRQLQSLISSFCGYYCCFYCMFRCRGKNINGVVNYFTRDTGFNDYIVHSFVCNKMVKMYFRVFRFHPLTDFPSTRRIHHVKQYLLFT